MISMKLPLSILLLLTTAAPTAIVAADEGALAVERISGPIDPMGSRLRPVGLPLRQADGFALSTRVRIGWNDEALSINFECEDTKISAVTSQNGVSLDGEDSLRVDLVFEDGRRFRLEASPLGARRAAWVDESGTATPYEALDDIVITSSVFGAGAFGTPAQPNQENLEGSSVGIDLPFALLGVDKPESGTTWQANFTRFDHDEESPVIWAWQEGDSTGTLRFE